MSIKLLLNKRFIMKNEVKKMIKQLVGNPNEYKGLAECKLSFFRLCHMIALLNQGKK